MKTLIALSGGLNSVAALWHYLVHTDDEVHAHHISLNGGRQRAEDDASAACVAYCQKIRPFGYTTSKRSTGLRWDVVLASDELGRLVVKGTIPKPDRLVRGSRHLEEFHAIRAVQHTEALAKWQSFVPGVPVTVEPTGDMTRTQQVAALPPELAAMTSSCRAPQKRGMVWEACRTCPTCREFLREKLVPLPHGLRAKR